MVRGASGNPAVLRRPARADIADGKIAFEQAPRPHRDIISPGGSHERSDRTVRGPRPAQKDGGGVPAAASVRRRSAEAILAEIGDDMSKFPTAAHIASWARVCPGNHESAGKRESASTGRGNAWLRDGLSQVAWAAARTKGSYYRALYYRRRARGGPKKAIVAVQHAILVAIWHMLTTGSPRHGAKSSASSKASTTPAGSTRRSATRRPRTSRNSTMRPEANLQHRGEGSSPGFSCSLASSESLVSPLHRCRGQRRNHIRHHQPQELTVRETGAGPLPP